MTLAGDPTDTETVEAQLFCRTSTSTAAAVDRYHDHLDRLRSMGIVDRVEVTSWPSRVELQASTEDVAASAFEEFSAWAEAEDVTLEPAFNVRTYESEFTGETGTRLITPVACLAVYRDGELADVYPHVEDGTVRTVEDGIAEIEASGATRYGSDGTALPSEPAE